MLSNIYIKNFAIIDEIEIDFFDNMSVLTGETGAGKSILIDAINVVFGHKQTKKIIRDEKKETEIICSFNINNENVIKVLEDKDLYTDSQCIFRRKINTKNISKIYINDKPVNSNTAKYIGSMIIDIHGQHENQLILSSEEQRNRVDNYINISKEKEDVKNILSQISSLEKELADNKISKNEYEDKISLLDFEINELQEETIDSKSYDKLSEEFSKLNNSEQLINKAKECLNIIDGDGGYNINSQLSQLNKILEEIGKIDDSSSEILNQNIIIMDQVKTLSKMIDKYSNAIDIDPEKLEIINNKILSLNKLSRKYKVNERDLNEILNDKNSQLQKLKNNRENFSKNIEEINKLKEKYHKIALKISNLRKKNSKNLESKITDQLKDLGMNNCQFKIDIVTDENLIKKDGYDKVSFLIKTNDKSKLLPLNEIASGGELSRLSLVIQLETRSNDDCETMIFDEIDTGIGGATAEILGQHLANLADKTQVLCVTHLAQVAAKSKHHYLVSKDKEISSTRLEYLDNELRVNELARMIGGVKLTEKALQFAKELID
tara:strand:+ start:887 stop:2536 length:1650 start_codon:yes stop_codon:yes gene_type:complete